jgi:hypothetical protein
MAQCLSANAEVANQAHAPTLDEALRLFSL